jgi:murein DD-endopeptidase MepM/ murein hydrolase activator NlpD
MRLLTTIQFISLFWLALGWMSARTVTVETGSTRIQLLSVSWEPAELVNGSPFLFRVKSERPLKSLSGEFLNRRIFFDFDTVSGTWCGFAGVSLDTAAGQHRLALNAIFANGARSTSSHSVAVGRGSYPSSRLRVSRKYTEPDPDTLVRIKQEQEIKREVFRRVSRNRLWRGSFVAPVDNITTGQFGAQRVFNGKVQSIHQGLDFRAETGTPVMAMNDGEVILSQFMFYEGGFLVIDHGQGMLAMYMHLSEFQVKEGEQVSKGQVVALSGDSGRVTAAHLHIGIRWQGEYLDPAAMLNLKLP